MDAERQDIFKCCRSAKKESPISSAVVVANAHLAHHPVIRVSVTPSGGSPVSTPAVADTGAQVCVAGRKMLATLRLKPSQLKPRNGLKDVADLPLSCMGTRKCVIELGGRRSEQEIYFIPTARNLFMSLRTCKDLGLVPEDFPNPAPLIASADVTAERVPKPRPLYDVTSEGETRSFATKPTTVPFPPTEENIPRLEKWLMRHFSSTTFNTNREPLPVMNGRPHHIHLLPDARPYACHTPIEVAKHWEDEVKAQLDEDVRKGVIEQVPAGDATEWCARMVVVPKNNG